MDFYGTFVVDSGSDAYKQFIDGVRNQLVNDRSACLAVPYLRPQEYVPNNWFDVKLIYAVYAVTLRIRSDSLYLDAYQAGGQWFEFDDAPHITPGATRLPFGGGYSSIERAAEIGTRGRAGWPLNGTYLGLAVANLGAEIASSVTKARQLLVLIQMINEAIRFKAIEAMLANQWSTATNPSGEMIALQNAWGALSGAVLQANVSAADDALHVRQTSNDLSIKTPRDASKVLGIMLCRSQNPPNFLKGRPMVEVFKLRIDRIDGENPGDLYGTVIAQDGLGRQYVYNRDRKLPEPIVPGVDALLAGPPETISAADGFSLIVDLWDYDYFSPDDSIAKGTIDWNIYDINNQYDKPLLQTVKGDYGSVTLQYVVLRDAAQALIEVVLINGDGEDPADVYGTIKTYNEYGWSSLFFKPDKSSYIQVHPNSVIPLSRSVVAVPTAGVLTVEALLFDYDQISSDDEIANGQATFKPQIGYPHPDVKSIKGKYGEISVKATWS
ncbi:ribosome-inactivating protein [Xylaria flabelliformis]|nr:ribosome-inactivating protein [Xylaria flabelliformis]